ncbi:MAG: hypothetical protein RL562_3336 [Planctomycetota bacterium]
MMSFRTIPALCALAAALPAQMEKRETAQYDEQAFVRSEPRVGDAAPDLVLCDMDGRPRSLHLLRGSTVVLIKGSYT